MSVTPISYGFTTVENPLSDSGNFTIVADTNFTGSLRVPSSGLCEPTTLVGPGAAFYSGQVWPNDHAAFITLATITTLNQLFDVIVRQGAAASGTQYLLVVEASGTYNLHAWVAGVPHNLFTASATVQVGDVWGLSAVGQTLSIWQNGAIIHSLSDSFISSGSPGFGISAITAITDAQISNFSAYAVAATPTISPNGGAFPATVTLTSSTGSTVYYTTDGSTPNSGSSSVASGGTVSINTSVTLKAIASFDATNFSGVASASFGVTAANFVAAQYNPSMALIGGWPFVQTAGDGNLGNKAAKESNANNPPSNADAISLGNAQAENTAAGGRGGRAV